jgi:phosphate-selective porin OprO/OprP
LNYARRPESHVAPVFVDTGPIAARSVDTGFFEAACLGGPFSLQAEGGVAAVKPPEGRRTVFHGFYVSGSYALTGEMRQYRRRRGTVARIQPKHSLGDGGQGAFEIALRLPRIDLNDGDIRGGALNDVSLAFNWYPNRPVKVSFNLIRANRQGPGLGLSRPSSVDVLSSGVTLRAASVRDMLMERVAAGNAGASGGAWRRRRRGSSPTT